MLKLTPGMKQYMEIKNANPDCIILFRMGDFYETFFEDAKVVARELEITLTSRGKGDTKAPLAGIPYHALDPYLAKLVKKGYKVGIVEQTEDPKQAKGLVKRELVKVITPGTVIESLILDKDKNNYIVSFFREKENYVISFCDISTGEFFYLESDEKRFFDELKRINPAEIIFPMSFEESEIVKSLRKENYRLNSYDDRFFYLEKAMSTLREHFDVLNMQGFGIESESVLSCCGALLSYIKKNQKNSLGHVNNIRRYKIDEYMYLDNSTIRNLELVSNIVSSDDNATFLSVIDKTFTPMGKRLMKRWVVSPLINKVKIEQRLEAVSELKDSMALRFGLESVLGKVYDIERLIGRVSYGNANPKDLVSLKASLLFIPEIKKYLDNTKSKELKGIGEIPDLVFASEIIRKAIKDEPRSIIREGDIIRGGYNSELDELREISL
ncbi:MAG: DNA mismatch repair protein MutS, partial [Candidatus Pacearchaeota archaeon]|nr:DNA mismatch repair protein MutS [Candidatus Pacearchaeota archaeon]